MFNPHGNQSNPYVYQPTRGDRRVARQLLADLRGDKPSSALGRLAAGRLGHIVRFVAGCGLTYVFHAWDERYRIYSFAGPAADSATLLIRRLLDDGPTEYIPALATDESSFSAVVAFRSPWIESAVDQLVDGLHERGLTFILGWQLPGGTEARLDCTLGAHRDKVDQWLNGFLTERLGVSVCGKSQHRPSKEVAAHA
jgi:hypothetical protein